MPAYQPPTLRSVALTAVITRTLLFLLILRFVLSSAAVAWGVGLLTVAAVGVYQYFNTDVDRAPQDELSVATEEEIENGNVGPRKTDLPGGFTEFDIVGPKDGQTVVFVHGFSIPSKLILMDLAAGLAAKGYRVVTFTLYGRGGSDTPRTDFNDNLFVSQLLSLVCKLKIDSPFHLLGTSMGGAISTRFAELYPDRVKSLILIAPAGLPAPLPPATKVLGVPVLGAILFHILFPIRARSSTVNDFADPDTPHSKKVIKAMTDGTLANIERTPGFLRALRSSILHFPMTTLEPSYVAWGKLKKPTLVIWGDNDKMVPYENAARLLKAVPHAVLESYARRGHMPHLEEPERALNDVLTHLHTCK